MNNSYLIKVKLEMDICCECCSNIPYIELPITVVTEVPPLPTLEKPQNWQPEVIQVTIIYYHKTLPIQFDETNQY